MNRTPVITRCKRCGHDFRRARRDVQQRVCNTCRRDLARAALNKGEQLSLLGGAP